MPSETETSIGKAVKVDDDSELGSPSVSTSSDLCALYYLIYPLALFLLKTL
jgi:hypothetical protein